MKSMFYVMSIFVGFYLLFGVVEMYEESLLYDEESMTYEFPLLEVERSILSDK